MIPGTINARPSTQDEKPVVMLEETGLAGEWVQRDNLTPAEARRLAAELLTAADIAESDGWQQANLR